MLSSSQIGRKQWQAAKATGKTQFLVRGVVGSLATGLIILLGLALLRTQTFRLGIVLALVMLPIFVVGGYLTASWQWQDFEKKYPGDRLPERK